MDGAVLEPAHAHQSQQLVGAGAAVGARHRAEPERHVVGHAEVGEERVVLKHEAQAALLGRDECAVLVRQHGATERDRPAVGLQETGEAAQRSRLSTPARAEQRHQLALVHAERQPVDDRKPAVGVAFGEALDVEQRHTAKVAGR